MSLDPDEAAGESPTAEPLERKSRSQLKREARAVYDMGEQLAQLPEAELAKLDLDEDLADAVRACRPLKKNARLRQLRFVAKLMRAMDTAPIAARLDQRHARHGAAAAEEQANEAWRRRLLDEGDPALSDLVNTYPQADRSELRALMRSARRPEARGATTARRTLLRAIRALRAGDGSHREAAHGDSGGD